MVWWFAVYSRAQCNTCIMLCVGIMGVFKVKLNDSKHVLNERYIKYNVLLVDSYFMKELLKSQNSIVIKEQF